MNTSHLLSMYRHSKRGAPFVCGVVAALLLGGNPALAVPVLQGPPTAATGITGLTIGGVLYDAHFDNAGISYNDLFAGGHPTFLNNKSGADDAAIAIRDVLRATGVSGIAGVVPDHFVSGGVDRVSFKTEIPYDVFSFGNPLQFAAQTTGPAYQTSHILLWDIAGSSASSLDTPLAAADTWITFGPGTPTCPGDPGCPGGGSVPEPGVLALLAAGLFLIQRTRQPSRHEIS